MPPRSSAHARPREVRHACDTLARTKSTTSIIRIPLGTWGRWGWIRLHSRDSRPVGTRSLPGLEGSEFLGRESRECGRIGSRGAAVMSLTHHPVDGFLTESTKRQNFGCVQNEPASRPRGVPARGFRVEGARVDSLAFASLATRWPLATRWAFEPWWPGERKSRESERHS